MTNLKNEFLKNLENLQGEIYYTQVSRLVDDFMPEDPLEIAEVILGRRFRGNREDYDALQAIAGDDRRAWMRNQLTQVVLDYIPATQPSRLVDEGEEIVDEGWF